MPSAAAKERQPVLSAVVFWERSSTENRFKSTLDWSS
jgi:hypothetical protein